MVGTVTLEATGDEIVAVEAVAPKESIAACITEVVWAARLTDAFSAHRTYKVELGQ